MDRKTEKRRIMLLPPTVFPIPATCGGAVEQLITHLLDINEKENRAKFIVVSKYEEQAAKIQYRNSDVYYLDSDGFVMGWAKGFRVLWALYRAWLKVFHNHVAERFLGKLQYRMDLYSFQCALIAKIMHVDVVVNELHDFGFDAPLAVFNDVVGREGFYNHIHSVREENLDSRRIINNSISISEYVRDRWVKDQSIKGKNEVLYNCVDVEKFQNTLSEAERIEARKKLGISEKEFLVLFCGRLASEKGVEQLLDAFDLLHSWAEKNIRLLLIGSAAFSMGNTTDFSRKIVERALNNPSVVVLGFIPNEQLPLYYGLSDAQVVPSIWQEGAGVVAIEGMAAGLPLIITQSGGMPEYVGKGAAIQLPIDSKLPEHIADAIVKLAQNPNLCKKMGDAGKKRAKDFSREAYYSSFLDIVGNRSDNERIEL